MLAVPAARSRAPPLQEGAGRAKSRESGGAEGGKKGGKGDGPEGGKKGGKEGGPRCHGGHAASPQSEDQINPRHKETLRESGQCV